MAKLIRRKFPQNFSKAIRFLFKIINFCLSTQIKLFVIIIIIFLIFIQMEVFLISKLEEK